MRPESADPISTLMRKHKEALRFEVPPMPVRRRRRNFFAPAAVLSAAAVACITISVLSFQLGRMSTGGPYRGALAEEVVSSHVRSLMANHLSDVMSNDRHTVKPWFEGKLDFGPLVSDFAREGFALECGRLDYIGGRAVAALVYRHGKHVVNVFEWPLPSGADSAPRLLTDRGFQLFVWQKNGLSFWVVSDVNAADLQIFASLLSES